VRYPGGAGRIQTMKGPHCQSKGVILVLFVCYLFFTVCLCLRQVSLCNWPHLVIILPQLPWCWDYRHVPLCLAKGIVLYPESEGGPEGGC
jgi:hypothetical protein